MGWWRLTEIMGVHWCSVAAVFQSLHQSLWHSFCRWDILSQFVCFGAFPSAHAEQPQRVDLMRYNNTTTAVDQRIKQKRCGKV